jgi:hypothetical protein
MTQEWATSIIRVFGREVTTVQQNAPRPRSVAQGIRKSAAENPQSQVKASED